MANACIFRDVNCCYCQKRGHIDITCYKKRLDKNMSARAPKIIQDTSAPDKYRTPEDFETSDHDECIQKTSP